MFGVSKDPQAHRKHWKEYVHTLNPAETCVERAAVLSLTTRGLDANQTFLPRYSYRQTYDPKEIVPPAHRLQGQDIEAEM